MSRELWFSLIEVRPLEGNEDFAEGDLGAFINVIGCAEGPEEFVALIRSELNEQRLELVSVDELDRLKAVSKWHESDELRYISSFISDEQRVVLGDRYMFEQPDSEDDLEEC